MDAKSKASKKDKEQSAKCPDVVRQDGDTVGMEQSRTDFICRRQTDTVDWPSLTGFLVIIVIDLLKLAYVEYCIQSLIVSVNFALFEIVNSV